MSNPTEGRCFWCHSLLGECHHCPSNEKGMCHEPDLASIATADTDITPDDIVIFDVSCKHCGRSGSFSINPKTLEIDW